MNIKILLPAVFTLVMGSAMLGLWFVLYTQKQIPELVTEPVRIGFHIAAEMITAILLVLSGIALLMGWQIATWLYPLSTGMLFYTAIVSPGYYAQKGQWGFVWMFLIILLLAFANLTIFL